MKKYVFNVVVFLLIITFPNVGFAQDAKIDELKFEVNRIYPYITIAKGELLKANKLKDLNTNYKSSWVETYISVEITTSHNGVLTKSKSKNDVLSEEQKEMMKTADAGSSISVDVSYIPQNTLSQNDPKKLHFALTVDPDSGAEFPGGQEQLNKYLKEEAISLIPDNHFKGYDLLVIKFTITEMGGIIDAHIFGGELQSNNDEKLNALLVETVRKMPAWKPAEYTDGTKVKQEFVLTIGNMKNCIVHTLNLHPNGLPSEE